MEARLAKFVDKGVDPTDGALLVAAGYNTPAQIRDAADEDLEDVIGEAETVTLRVIFPERQ